MLCCILGRARYCFLLCAEGLKGEKITIFLKRSDIRPRSDKGDLLGDLGDLEEAVGGDVVPHEVEAVGGGEGAAHGWCPAPGPGRSPVLRPVGAHGPAFSPA